MDLLTALETLDSLDSDYHPLLDPKPQNYSHTTVRRAFIVWLRCGQRNQFRDVCDYYHRLEAMEEQMPADVRAASRDHELSLFTSLPPTSPYLQKNFPSLYCSPHLEHQGIQGYPLAHLQNYHMVVEQKNSGVVIEEIKEGTDVKHIMDQAMIGKTEKVALTDKEIFESSQAFRSDCKFEDVKLKNRIGLAFAKLNADDVTKLEEKNIKKDEENKPTGTSKKDILETSQLIKNYCTDHQVPLNNFLENFKEHASRCELTNTVTNVGLYIKRKMVQAELGLAVKVHRAKVYNNGNKESRFKVPSPPANVKPIKVDTLNIDNKALVNGFAKLSMQVNKTNGNDEPKADVSTTKVFGVKDKNNIDKKITLLKREDIDVPVNNVGFSNTHLTKVDAVIYRKI